MIWFKQTSPEVTLETIKNILEQEYGAKVEYTQWKLKTFVVPQLKVTCPVEFLIQLNNTDVNEEAQEFAQSDNISTALREKLITCDARLECGDDCYRTVISENSVTGIIEPTEFDPNQPEAHRILSQLSRTLEGIFDDNVNGLYHYYDSSDALKRVKQDFYELAQEEPFHSYLEMLESRDPTTQNYFGTLYSDGELVSQDDEMAIIWFQKAAESGFAIAQYNLGLHYMNGQGTSQDLRAAFEWFEKAAEQGDEYAKEKIDILEQYRIGNAKDSNILSMSSSYTMSVEDPKTGFKLPSMNLGDKANNNENGSDKSLFEKLLTWAIGFVLIKILILVFK